jgi:hypothetical protein
MAPRRPSLPAVLSALTGWPHRSQQHARRNALVAATALTRRRIERDEVEAFLLAHERRHSLRQRPASGAV